MQPAGTHLSRYTMGGHMEGNNKTAKLIPPPMPTNNDIQDVTDITGGFGRWQLSIFIVIFYLELVCHALADLTLFLVPSNLDYWCEGTLPAEESKCFKSVNGTLAKCTSWVFDRSVYSSSLVERWGLVCEHSWLVSFSMSATALGFFMGCLVSVHMGDIFGRRRSMLLLSFPALLSSVGPYLVPNIGTFLLCRIIAGMSAYGITTCGYVLLTEIVGVESRSLTGILVKTGASAGKIYMCIMGYTLGKWTYIQFSVTLPVCLIPLICWMLPESPRWLILNNRLEEATTTISQALRWNKIYNINLEESIAKVYEKTKLVRVTDNEPRLTFFDLLHAGPIRLKTITLLWAWVTIGFVGFGIGSNINIFGKNSLSGVLSLSSAGLPGEALAAITVPKYGSRVCVLMGLSVIALVSMICSQAENSSPAMQILLVTIIQSQVAFVYCGLFLLTVEVFPTVLRVAGLGACSTITKVPGMAAPYIKEMKRSLGYSSPFVLFATLTGSAALAVARLRNSQRTNLLETLQDEEVPEQHVA